MDKKLVVFDLCGTLVDITEGMMQSYGMTAEVLCLMPDIEGRKSFDKSLDIKEGFRRQYEIEFETQLDQAVEYYKSMFQTYGKNKVQRYKGVPELFQSLKKRGLRVGVVSTLSEEITLDILKRTELIKSLDVIECGEDSDKSELFSRAVKKLGYSPEQAVFVGDSESDFECARRLGASFVGVCYGYGIKSGKEYDFTVAREATDVIGKI